MNKYTITLTFALLISLSGFSQRGKDGNVTVNTASRIVNEYTTLTANANTGNTSITVAASGLNTNSRFSGNLAAGDLIMIIQMQGATILGQPDAGVPTISNPNDATWGTITNYNNCGNYEYCQVSGVPNNTTINIDCGLTNSYTATGRVQIIRVPRYNTLTLTSPGTIIAQTWNGTSGGVVAIEVLGNTLINAGARIDVSGLGFRGGALFTTSGRTTTVLYSCVSLDVGTNKGEGIAGFDNDYTPYGGKYCRGAAANAGGGGNVWNCGGGGGGNAGNINNWSGQGNPDSGPAGWAAAWNLESAGFSTHTSSGGGRGGYSFSNSNQNATTLGPGTIGVGNAWGGSFRYNLGGLGGRPMDYSTGKIFMGGGGGAGEQDNNRGGAGGRGAGIIFLTSYGTISGAGTIVADGANGNNTVSGALTPGVDGAGGAGAGGTIILNSVGAISGITASANGGAGGNQIVNGGTSEAEGPGGGGGGGYIAISNGAIVQTANGGANGTTNASHLTEFTANGATRGGAGLTSQTISNFTYSIANATICAGQTANLSVSTNGTVPGGTTFNWYTTPTGGSPIGTGTNFTTPILNNTTSYYIQSCPGTYREEVIVTVNPSPNITVNSASICAGQTANLTANGGTTYTWSAGATSTGVNTADVSPIITTTYTVTGTTAGCTSTAVATVTITPGPTITVTSATICAGQTANLTANGGTTYTWSAGATSTGTNTADASPAITTTYTVTGTTSGCTGTAVATVTVSPNLAIIVNSPSICAGQTANLTASGATSYVWTAGATSTGTNTADASPTTTTSYTVTGTTAGCTGSAVSTVTVNPIPAITVNSPTICNGETANLSASGGTAYTWSSGATSTGASTADASPSTTTTYTVTETGSGCNGTATATVTVNPIPTITVNSPTICNGQTASLTANGGTTYTWSAGATSTGTNTADASPTTTTSYTVTGTTAGCSNTAVAIVTVAASLVITVNSPTICAGDTAFLSASGANTYTWSTGANSTGISSATATPLTTTTYTVIGLSGGCTGIGTSVVTVNNLPTITVNSTTICEGQTASLTANGGTTYSWSTGATPTGTNTADASPITTTSFTVTGTDNGCSSTATATVTVTPLPIVTVNSSVICIGQTANLTANGASTYAWTAGATATGTNTADATPTSTTTYTVTGTTNGCSSTATSTVTVNSIPTPSFSSIQSSGCAPLCVTFNESVSNNCNSLNYTFGDGNSSTLSSPNHCYTQAGTYSVTITCTDNNGCVGTSTINNMITVFATPVADFNISPSTMVAPNTQVDFNDISSGGTSVLWNFGDPLSVGNTSISNSASHTYTTEGNYCIELIVTNIGGCADTTVKCITVINEAVISVPNVFTPNGDGNNDYFTI
ncbi:MAG: PKD domain-containing protein, partial [Bacteroidia bacterium]|nr:PKD domain-containing protein [Bacteroidia bacterium]